MGVMVVLTRRRVAVLAATAVGGVAAIAAALFPGLVARHMSLPAAGTTSWELRSVIRAYSVCVLIGCVLIAVRGRLSHDRRPRTWGRTLMLAISAMYLVLVLPLRDWVVDDAAITFAYAENLVRGHGLVLAPGQAPEEGFSDPLWLLLITLPRLAGVELSLVAKTLGAACGIWTIVVTCRGAERLLRSSWDMPRAFSFAVVLLGAPFLIWSVSGLEHALQAALFATCAASSLLWQRHLAVTATCLAGLCLLRPEAPLIAAAVLAGYVSLVPRPFRLRALVPLWPLVVLPGLALCALFAARLSYFGDLLPNPYYAKASGSNPLAVFNALGGGWQYVLDWLRSCGAVLLIPLLVFVIGRGAALALRVAWGIIAAQLGFAIFVGGDWMGTWRFISPLLALFALLLAAAFAELGTRLQTRPLRALLALGAAFVGLSNFSNYAAFVVNPTTPYASVAHIGAQFVALAKRLNVPQPTLACHDAGGTSYAARLNVIDLGGLGSRRIAKGFRNPAALRDYLLDEVRPSFVFGSTTRFAAAISKFHLDPRFTRDYVRLEFPDDPLMQAELRHVRRDLVSAAPGVLLVYKGTTLDSVRLKPQLASHVTANEYAGWNQ